eukprot:768036-Hanusia_phi.AAC.3
MERIGDRPAVKRGLKVRKSLQKWLMLLIAHKSATTYVSQDRMTDASHLPSRPLRAAPVFEFSHASLAAFPLLESSISSRLSWHDTTSVSELRKVPSQRDRTSSEPGGTER